MNWNNVFARKLKWLRRKHGQRREAFARELGISFAALQSYESGTFPTLDVLFHIAEKLSLPPASLLCCEEANLKGCSCLDVLYREILYLHPNAREYAMNALVQLQTAFRISEEQKQLDEEAAALDLSALQYQYVVQDPPDTSSGIAQYSLLVKELRDGKWCFTGAFLPAATDRYALMRMAQIATIRQIPPSDISDLLPVKLQYHPLAVVIY